MVRDGTYWDLDVAQGTCRKEHQYIMNVLYDMFPLLGIDMTFFKKMLSKGCYPFFKTVHSID